MSPPENEEDTKKRGLQPEPLCLFCFPEDTFSNGNKTYINTLRKEPETRRTKVRQENVKQIEKSGKEKEEFWLRKRTEARIRRRRMKGPIRNLKSFLLASVKNEKVQLPSIFQVLEIVKDAWPSPSSKNVNFRKLEVENQVQEPKNQFKMKNEQIGLQFSPQLLNRRLSMPEELMRKYSVSKERTSEESEANKTTIDVSPSSTSTLETARRKDTERIEDRKEKEPKTEGSKTDACQQTSETENEKSRKAELPKRVTQSDFYKQGKQIIKVKKAEKGICTCGKEGESSTTASAKEETDESGTTESIPSSSPTQLPKRESSSGNLSSESDNIRCTCAELSSKETSTDLYFSGKSTLSQTVSDKSMSTQDSTISINSVSTRGSTVSDNSNSTTPEIERTSAKETTTSPDYSPRTPRNRKNRRRDKNMGIQYDHSKTCPRYNEPKYPKAHLTINYSKQCPVHFEEPSEKPKTTTDAATNTESSMTHATEVTNTTKEVADSKKKDTDKTEPKRPGDQYKWAKLSQEELYMMQQLRHRKFIESQRKLPNPLPPTPDTDSITACGTGSCYKETEHIDQPIMIPRYSALPRSLSMLVNTSSADNSHNSDSDNQSLADSLEDQPVTHIHKLYFDTKKESKPVRGDASIVQDTKFKHRQPRGRAFFVSIKEPFGEDEMLESIEKIPQPPEKIKNQIFERHLNLCAKHKHTHGPEGQRNKGEIGQKKKKIKNKLKESEKNVKTKINLQEENKKNDQNVTSEREKQEENKKPKREPAEDRIRKRKERKDSKGRFGSKIPVLISSRSTSSSPERDSESKGKPDRPKIRLRRDSEETRMEGEAPKEKGVETTQILEITHTGADLALQKPQAVIHPSQAPFEAKPEPQLTIPPLASTFRIPSLRQTWNKQLLLAPPVRKSPIGKFRQRFEVIPEEKSSSLSSAEEKNGRVDLPKFSDASTSPMPTDKIQFQSYSMKEVPNLIVAKITDKQLETLPYVRGSESQKIFLFSSKPQNSNSSKGRDALIAMNREDFNRLAKGWMNFYKLSENMENSENEDEKLETKKLKNEINKQCLNEVKTKQEVPELGENIRFDCSNTILRTTKSMPANDSSRSIKKQNSLPELETPNMKTREVPKSNPSGFLLRVEKPLENEEDTDSDSTDYMEPPSPRVPPLPIDDIPSDATLSSSDSELNAPNPPTNQTLKYLQFKRRGATNRTRLKKENPFESSRFGKKKNSGWSVTVAGTVELSRSAPDLEMRLSFPTNGGPPLVSQSDSGFIEDSKHGEALKDLDSSTSRKELGLGEGNSKQKWMVTVKNPKQGEGQGQGKQSLNTSNNLPELEPRNKDPNKVLKEFQLEEKMKHLVERKMRAIWPKVQNVIRNEFLTESGRLITEFEDRWDGESCLSVRGSAVSMKKKQKFSTMTERDITRRFTSRKNE